MLNSSQLNSLQITKSNFTHEPYDASGFYRSKLHMIMNGQISFKVGRKVHDIQFKDMKVDTSDTFHIHSNRAFGTQEISFDISSLSVSSSNNPKINSWSSMINTGYISVSSLHIIKTAIANSIRQADLSTTE